MLFVDKKGSNLAVNLHCSDQSERLLPSNQRHDKETDDLLMVWARKTED